jgi:hypothetical protein
MQPSFRNIATQQIIYNFVDPKHGDIIMIVVVRRWLGWFYTASQEPRIYGMSDILYCKGNCLLSSECRTTIYGRSELRLDFCFSVGSSCLDLSVWFKLAVRTVAPVREVSGCIFWKGLMLTNLGSRSHVRHAVSPLICRCAHYSTPWGRSSSSSSSNVFYKHPGHISVPGHPQKTSRTLENAPLQVKSTVGRNLNSNWPHKEHVSRLSPYYSA